MTTKDAGPIGEPWITLAKMSVSSEVSPSNLVQCEWPLKKSLVQLYTASGRARRAIFSTRTACLTVSKALLKSKANTRTNGCVSSMVKTVCRRVMRAASVEPVGLNANWSVKFSPSGGVCSAG